MANLQSTTISGGLSHTEGTAVLSGGDSLTIDLSTGRTFEIDLEQCTGVITTFNITNFAGATYVTEFILKVKTHVFGVPAAIYWGSLTGVNPLWPGDGGSAGSGPTITATTDKIDIYKFSSWDGGTSWYGRVIGQNY